MEKNIPKTVTHHTYGPLDEIRGIAALAVFLIHFIQLYYNTKTLGILGARADVLGVWGVSIFFILSGFLIHSGTRREFEKTNTVSWKNYFMRRFFRIYPPFLVCLIFSYVLGKYFQSNMISNEDFGNLFAHITMISTYFTHYFENINAIFWTVIVEVHFYIIYPVLWWMLRRYSIWTVLGVTLLIGLAYFVLSAKFTVPGPERIMHQHTSVALLWKWVLGMVLAEFYYNLKPKGLIKFLSSTPVTFIALLLCFVPLVFMSDSMSLQYQRFVLPVISFVFFGGLIFSPVKTWSSNILKWMGKISYSFYLWHPVSLLFVSMYFHEGNAITFLVCTVSSLLLAWASFHITEAPSITWGKNVINSLSKSSK
ncbi:acyltransferase family protein [Flavobacterium sp. Sd200]|uniref:acyltransferase family protein n=1 Tax=Flavobacterium sp. Sd200 TaxID=2692211 RepID=UPI00136DB6AA|nr:acyltransferase [Flavobacterium sp. Sd200]MXN91971.1 acyltransferase family protein [Flavobacterium sp. Sd200]